MHTQSLMDFSRLWQNLAELGRSQLSQQNSAEFDRVSILLEHSFWQNLAEFGRIRSSWQNLAELICRAFYRDIPIVTGPVPLQNFCIGTVLSVKYIINYSLSFLLCNFFHCFAYSDSILLN